MRSIVLLGTLALGSLGGAATVIHRSEGLDADLVARAKISPDQARARALAAVPGGSIAESEIEEENGRLIYSFDLEVDGQSGKREVEIDAITGQVLADQDDEVEDDEEHDDDRNDHEDSRIRPKR
jgi:peptidase YpeB-like protein